MIDDLIKVDRLSYGEAVLDKALTGTSPIADLCSLDDFLLDVTTRKTRREPTMMDLLVAEALRDPGPTRRWFLKAGLSIGAVAFMSAFPGAPVKAAGATFFAATTGDNSDGTTWAKAKTTITAGIAVCAAGDFLLVDATYAVTAGAAVTWTPPAGGLAIISVTPSGASGFSAFTVGAAESIGSATNTFTIGSGVTSSMYLWGMVVNSSTSASAAGDIAIFTASNTLSTLEAKSCTFDMKGTSTTAQLVLGTVTGASGKGQLQKFIDCTFICSGSRAGTLILFGSPAIEMINPTFSMTGGTKPAVLFADASTGGDHGPILIRDGDISGYAVSSGVYFSVTDFYYPQITLENLKISATPAMTSGTWPGGIGSLTLRNVDSADTIYRYSFENAYGTVTATNSIYVSAGKTFNGAGIGWQIVTKSTASQFTPFVTPYLFIWDTTTTSQTAEIEFIRDNATAMTDLEIWSSLDSAASASFPNYAYQTNRNAQPFVGTPANQPTSTATWTGTGGFSNPTKQKLQMAFTAAEVGLLQSRISVAVATTTLYVGPYLGGVT